SSRGRHTRFSRDWSSDVCSSDLTAEELASDALLDLAASLAAHDAQSRPVALRALRQRLATDTNRALLRTFAARAVEQADWGALKIGRASCRERGQRSEKHGRATA